MTFSTLFVLWYTSYCKSVPSMSREKLAIKCIKIASPSWHTKGFSSWPPWPAWISVALPIVANRRRPPRASRLFKELSCNLGEESNTPLHRAICAATLFWLYSCNHSHFDDYIFLYIQRKVHIWLLIKVSLNSVFSESRVYVNPSWWNKIFKNGKKATPKTSREKNDSFFLA